jgi:hypothetical protein
MLRQRHQVPVKVQHTKSVKWKWKLLLRLWDFRMPVPRRSILRQDEQATIKSLLKPGDIFLEANNAYPLSQVITKILDGSNWIHSAIYVGDNKVIDAGRKPCVARTKLDRFLQTTDLAIYRPQYHSPEDILAVLSFAKSSIGVPFNLNFDDTDTHTFYCTQLVSRALLSMPHPIQLRTKTIFWKTAVPTSSVATASEIDCIWSSQPNFWRNIAVHWPIVLSAMLGAYCGGRLSIYGFLPGIIFGALLSILMVHRMTGQKHRGVLGSST